MRRKKPLRSVRTRLASLAHSDGVGLVERRLYRLDKENRDKGKTAESSSDRAELAEVFLQGCCRNWETVWVVDECWSRKQLVFLNQHSGSVLRRVQRFHCWEVGKQIDIHPCCRVG